jgi:DNA-binding XRE family transcriptional regulator
LVFVDLDRRLVVLAYTLVMVASGLAITFSSCWADRSSWTIQSKGPGDCFVGRDSRTQKKLRIMARILALIVDNARELPPLSPMDSTVEIMSALRAARALAGLSQEELAALAGVSRQIVARIEKGESNVLVDAIAKVRSALEGQGVVFKDGTAGHGPSVAMARSDR